jgi:hypothetical protein
LVWGVLLVPELFYYQKQPTYYQKSGYIIKTTLLLSKIEIYYQNLKFVVLIPVPVSIAPKKEPNQKNHSPAPNPGAKLQPLSKNQHPNKSN